MNRAPAAVATAIEEANQEYLAKFGFIFIICATGKTAEEMLDESAVPSGQLTRTRKYAWRPRNKIKLRCCA